MHKCSKKGFTLIELLVVMAIISMVMGIGSALFSQMNKRLATQSVALEVRNIFRFAKNYALESKDKTQIAKNDDYLIVSGRKIRGYWHLEEIKNRVSDGFGFPIKIEGEVAITKGRIGKCVSLNTESYLDCGEVSYLELGENFSICFSIFFSTASSNERPLFTIGDSYSLRLLPSHRLKLTWGESEFVTEYFLPLFQWVDLKIYFDKNTCQVYANNVNVLQQTRNDDFYNYQEGNLIFAQGTTCLLDEIHISSIVEVEKYQIPENFTLENFTSSIFFNKAGRLALEQHLSPVIVFVKENVSEQVFGVETSLMGNIDIVETINGK